MIRSFGVARVLSVKRMQTLSSGLIRSRSGDAPIGFSNDSTNAARSSANASA